MRASGPGVAVDGAGPRGGGAELSVAIDVDSALRVALIAAGGGAAGAVDSLCARTAFSVSDGTEAVVDVPRGDATTVGDDGVPGRTAAGGAVVAAALGVTGVVAADAGATTGAGGAAAVGDAGACRGKADR
jgi:hypothetical protein